MQKSLLVTPSSIDSERMKQTDEKLAGKTGHVCVLISGANIAEYGRNNSACVPFQSKWARALVNPVEWVNHQPGSPMGQIGNPDGVEES